ncbi:MAG: hypothetical protein K8T89_09380 [Planctomycetes bacterium]|nr:hypothetical protein [Planctomycetota bacterium]
MSITPPITGVFDGRDLLKPNSSPAFSHAWRKLIDELVAIRRLEDDWDGQGAQAPEVALVDSAIALARYFQSNDWPTANFVIAGGNGTIIFEWQGPEEFLEIEVTATNAAEGRQFDKRTNTSKSFLFSPNSPSATLSLARPI